MIRIIQLFSYSVILLFCYSVCVTAQIQVAPDRYRIEFTDKNNSSFSIDKPQLFLSEKALQRRAKHGFAVTDADMPVSAVYIDSLKKMGFDVMNCSRWFNSAILRSSPEEIEKLDGLSFIKHNRIIKNELEQVGIIDTVLIIEGDKQKFALEYEKAPDYYGMAAEQIGMLKGHLLHERGFRGQGIFIAVIDGGFYNVNELSGFDSLHISGRLKGFKNFTHDIGNPLGNNNHGTNVLSILAACIPDTLIGSAPEADYLLLRSEETEHEYLVEEDNWIAAAEYADSIGVDMISSSLGYSRFDDATQNHTHEELDGRTIRVSRAATMAAARGILVCISAGNSGIAGLKSITAPADADSIITVGAVNRQGTYANFSSCGPTADNRTKPELVAVGSRTAYQNSMGAVLRGNGTSYSTPLLAGIIACFWQANPDKTNMQIIEAIKKSASHFDAPDHFYGYGIPDFGKLIETTETSQ